MKKLVLFLMLCISTTVVAQTGTTAEEYNYAVKGFKIQQESGLDTKKGYKIEQGMEFYEKSAYITFYPLLRLSTQEGVPHEYACTIIRYKGNGIDKYLCLPNSDASSDIWNAYNDSVEKLKWYSSSSDSVYCGFSIAVSKFSSALAKRLHEILSELARRK